MCLWATYKTMRPFTWVQWQTYQTTGIQPLVHDLSALYPRRKVTGGTIYHTLRQLTVVSLQFQAIDSPWKGNAYRLWLKKHLDSKGYPTTLSPGAWCGLLNIPRTAGAQKCGNTCFLGRWWKLNKVMSLKCPAKNSLELLLVEISGNVAASWLT